ncbi:MAG: choline/carnitine O-acyltransferase [Gaiellaceae bacterium]
MLRFQADLERLPVPALEETCELYLRLVGPLLSDGELTATRRAVAELVRPGGQGEVLQSRLRALSETVDNWLEPFWDDHYLCDDTPLPVNVSPGFVLSGQGRPQVARAAGLLSAALRFKELVAGENLEPDLEKGAPRCMSDYSRVLCSTRIPGASRDRLERHPEGRHVVVARNCRFFSLDVLDENGRPYAVEDLELALQGIMDDVESPGPTVGALTTDERRTWAQVREEHLRQGSPSTQAALATLESAILLLVLETEPTSAGPRSGDAARLMLHGDARGRWFDKSIQLVVASNGIAGFCTEHAGFDGNTSLRFAEFLVEHEDRSLQAPARGVGPAPRRLEFDVTEPLREAIVRARQGADELLVRTDLAVLDFLRFGKREIVRHGVSPDGFVQMAFQLAYFTLTGETASTYESVDMKRYLHGRTEAMRCVSPESVSFVRALRAPGRRDSRAAAERLRAAIASHGALVQRCKEGRGVERHLLGLRRMIEPGETSPALLTDKGYSTLTRSVLSTSALPSSPGVELTCFGPVVDEGVGLSYTIHEESVCSVVTNFHGLADAFADELANSMLEMRALLAAPG